MSDSQHPLNLCPGIHDKDILVFISKLIVLNCVFIIKINLRIYAAEKKNEVDRIHLVLS